MNYKSCLLLLIFTSVNFCSLFGKTETHNFFQELKENLPEKIEISDYINNQSNSSDHQSFAGSIAVRENGSTIFYQLYSPKGLTIEDQTAPLIVWLQGGPGCSSLMGNYEEMGPYFAYNLTSGNKTETKLKSNPDSWSNIAHMLFVDQPIGVGFSQLGNYSVPESTAAVAKDFETFLMKFFLLYPNYKNNNFYIFGEGFGGQFIPVFATYIVQNSEVNKITLSGIGIGDGWTDPISHSTSLSSYAYSAGIISGARKQLVRSQEGRISNLISSGKYRESSEALNALIGDGDQSMTAKSGGAYLYNFRQYINVTDKSIPPSQLFLNSKDTLAAFGFNKTANLTWAQCNYDVYNAFTTELSKSYKQNISYLLERIRVLIFNGQDDILVNTPGSQSWITTLNWPGVRGWQLSRKQIWNTSDKKIVGTMRKYSNLSVATIYKAGPLFLLPPNDQGPAFLDMLRRWSANEDNWNN